MSEPQELVLESQAEAGTGLRDILLGTILILLTAAIYWQIRDHAFLNFDDDRYVSDNPIVARGLSQAGIAWAFTTFDLANWHPVTWLSLMLDCSLFGPKAERLLQVNLLFHLANVGLLFGWLRAMTKESGRSLLVAALFALHPMHVESVAWIAERKDVLSAFFWLLTCFAYWRYVAGTRTWSWYGLAFLFCLLAVMAKPMAVTLPFVLLLLDVWPLKCFGWGADPENPPAELPISRLILEKIPFFALSLGGSILTYLAQRASGATSIGGVRPLGERLGNALASYACYVGKTLWPAKLAVFYPYESHPEWWKLAAGVGLLVGVTGLAVYLVKTRPFVATGWFWFIGVLVPVIGLVQVGEQSMADRYTYLPHIGLFLLVVWGLGEFVKARPVFQPVAVVAALAAVAGCGWATWRYLPAWSSRIDLFEHALAVTSNNHIAECSLGQGLMEQNRNEEAEPHLRAAVRIQPGYDLAKNTLAYALVRQGKYPEALTLYQELIRRRPDYGDAHIGYASALENLGRADEAIESYAKGLELVPDNANASNKLGVLLYKKGRTDDAIVRYRQALRFDPQMSDAAYNLGNALAVQGKYREAREQFEYVLKLNPGDLDAPNKIKLMDSKLKQ
ncbi:MAG: tetratricopeptide repeat protein [Blastocatellia bacterium]|nr:tetratricopeptide repeat protein [Blastocatellia bacterium]